MSKYDWGSLPRAEVGSLFASGAVAAMAVGALEQHGDHLPTDTDTYLVSTFLSKAAEASAAQVVLLPTLPFGFSPYHQHFGGTVSFSSSGFLTILTDICSSVRSAGASTFLLLNGHGGNEAPLKIASHDNSDLDFKIITTSYWDVVSRAERAMFEQDDGEIGHAGQVETSLILALRPECVGPLPELSEPVRPHVRPPTIDLLGESGVIGDADAANPELGRQFATAIVDGLTALLNSLGVRSASPR